MNQTLCLTSAFLNNRLPSASCTPGGCTAEEPGECSALSEVGGWAVTETPFQTCRKLGCFFNVRVCGGGEEQKLVRLQRGYCRVINRKYQQTHWVDGCVCVCSIVFLSALPMTAPQPYFCLELFIYFFLLWWLPVKSSADTLNKLEEVSKTFCLFYFLCAPRSGLFIDGRLWLEAWNESQSCLSSSSTELYLNTVITSCSRLQTTYKPIVYWVQ